MKPWKNSVQKLGITISLGLFLAAGAGFADDLRVKIGQGSQLEIRCDGPLAVVVENRSSEAKELQPGVYTLRIVDSPRFFRAEPLVAGLISSPFAPLSATTPSAVSAPSESWVVELVRTPSRENAERAERAAKVQVKGKIQLVQRNGEYVVQMGPFPNRYLAQQGLQKAQGFGFPARVQDLAGVDIWDNAGAVSPRAYRRLEPKGTSLPPRPAPAPESEAETEPVAPPPHRMTVEVPPEPKPEDGIVLDLEPLPLFSDEDLALEPLPSEPEEDILIQPFAEPVQENLTPDAGLIPAPQAPQQPTRDPIRIRPSTPRNVQRPQTAQAPGPRNLPPQARRPMGPPPQPRSEGPRPQPRQVRPTPIAPPSQQAEPQTQVQAPQPPPQAPANQPPMQQRPPQSRTAPPAIAQAPPPSQTQPAPPQHRHLDRWVPERQATRGSNVPRSLPFLRRFSWQKPLVEPPREDFPSLEERFAKALQEPSVPSAESDVSVADGARPDGVPYAPEMTPDLSTISGSTPSTVLDDDLSFAGAKPGQPEEESKIVPFQEPTTAELPSETPSLDSLDFSSDIVPPAPGENGARQAPLLGDVPSAPSTGDSVAKSAPATAISGQPRLVSLPAMGPVRRGYVQLFNDRGEPVTEAVAQVDIAPLSSSRLEYKGHGYSGTFQAYAPTDSQMVLVNITDLQDYVAGIVPEEISPEAPVEVLKAQAVLVRGYTLVEASQGLHAEYGFDLDGDENAVWPFKGTDSVTAAVRQAVSETQSEVLIDEAGAPATPVYCFSSGGYLADAQSLWGGTGVPVPAYLTAKPDFDRADVPEFTLPSDVFATDEGLLEDWLQSTPNTYDREAAGPYFRWEVRFTDEEMTQAVNAYWNGTVGQVRSIRITKRALSGHAVEMEIRGADQTVTARSSDMIREALNLNSSLIVIKERFGPGGGWVVYGGGLGHGAGFSQCGAIGLVSKKGANYKQLLNYYFEGLRLGRRMVTRERTGV